MRYKFIGKPDKIFPHLVTGRVYDLDIEVHSAGPFGWLFGKTRPVITSPIRCPYDSWRTFFYNWEELDIT